MAGGGMKTINKYFVEVGPSAQDPDGYTCVIEAHSLVEAGQIAEARFEGPILAAKQWEEIPKKHYALSFRWPKSEGRRDYDIELEADDLIDALDSAWQNYGANYEDCVHISVNVESVPSKEAHENQAQD